MKRCDYASKTNWRFLLQNKVIRLITYYRKQIPVRKEVILDLKTLAYMQKSIKQVQSRK